MFDKAEVWPKLGALLAGLVFAAVRYLPSTLCTATSVPADRAAVTSTRVTRQGRNFLTLTRRFPLREGAPACRLPCPCVRGLLMVSRHRHQGAA